MGDERLERFQALAIADGKVLIAGPASAPMTDREKLLIMHTVSLMDAIATNIHEVNASLTERLARCLEHCEDGEGPEMGCVA